MLMERYSVTNGSRSKCIGRGNGVVRLGSTYKYAECISGFLILCCITVIYGSGVPVEGHDWLCEDHDVFPRVLPFEKYRQKNFVPHRSQRISCPLCVNTASLTDFEL
jgi:hypothetical protein